MSKSINLSTYYVRKTEILDVLNSESTTNPLSANQGKQLKTLADSKVSINQGTANEGKILKVGSDGNLGLATENTGSNITVDNSLSNSSTNPVQNKVIKEALDPDTFTDLQTLITNASSGDTIILDKDYKYNSTTDSSLSSGIEITKNITIIGNGHIIDGNNYARAFIDSGENGYTWELNDLRIQNCINDNCKYGYRDGGAIYSSYGILTITNCTFAKNEAYDNGGAIYNDGTITINNTTLTQNIADYGGAIYAYNSQITMKESIVKNNTANNYANIYSDNSVTVYNCDINNINTTCYNITNKNYLTDHQSLTDYIQKSNTTGLVKNDGSIDTTSYSTFSGSYIDLTNKPTIPSSNDVYGQIMTFGNALLTELGAVDDGDDEDY